MGVGRILCIPPKLLERCRDASVSSSIGDCVRYLPRSNLTRDIVLGGTTVEPGEASGSSALRQRIYRSASRNVLRIGVSLPGMGDRPTKRIRASAAGTVVDRV